MCHSYPNPQMVEALKSTASTKNKEAVRLLREAVVRGRALQAVGVHETRTRSCLFSPVALAHTILPIHLSHLGFMVQEPELVVQADRLVKEHPHLYVRGASTKAMMSADEAVCGGACSPTRFSSVLSFTHFTPSPIYYADVIYDISDDVVNQFEVMYFTTSLCGHIDVSDHASGQSQPPFDSNPKTWTPLLMCSDQCSIPHEGRYT